MRNNFIITLLVASSILAWFIGSSLFFHFMKPSSLYTDTMEPVRVQKVVSLWDLQQSVTNIVDRVYDSTVSIVIKKDLVLYRNNPYSFFNTPVRKSTQKVWWGTWFFITKDGYIITNKHVVENEDASYTVITSDNREYEAKILAIDPITDLAVIKIESDKGFQPLHFVDHTDGIHIGQFVVAVGNALSELQNSVSLGIVSGKNRVVEWTWYKLAWLLQTDAAINPGNSGGPLVNLDGDVVGINTAIATNSDGIWFSIPLTDRKVSYLLSSIQEYGTIKKPFIGVNYILLSDSVSKELGKTVSYGAYISEEDGSIVKWSSAEKYGLRPGDIILEIDGQKITFKNDLNTMIQNKIPGDELQLKVLRKPGKQEDIELKLWAL
jgi:serine protease Do